jgi:glycyl-tRNA synthetase beta chain
MPDPVQLLVEIGTEELPPKALRAMAETLAREIREGLVAHGLEIGAARSYATPRRLAVVVENVPVAQPDREVARRGPGVHVAFDADGNPTRAAEGFARSVGLEVDQLERLETDDGAWLMFRTTEVGQPTTSLVQPVVEQAIARLPVPRRMRWADLDVEFSRPVHWVVALLGAELVEAHIMGLAAGRTTRGHRFHHPAAIAIDDPAAYATTLREQGRVIADLDERKETIRAQVEEAANALGGTPVMDDALLEEVAALVEWPVPVVGAFDEAFLELPDAVLIATMQGHQRYFPVRDSEDRLLARFVTISNIDSNNPQSVREGNERVVRPRLNDAAFFFRTDLQTALGDRRPALASIVFQEELGSVLDKSARVARLAGHVAIAMGRSPEEVKLTRRAAELSKCDLVTAMVGEFPELQGTIGGAYARHAGEPEAVAEAIAELYLPRFAGDAIPASAAGRALAIADKLDTLVGIFGIGQAPTGDRDPFALRRSALGILRIIIEGDLDLDLPRLVIDAAEGYEGLFEAAAVRDAVSGFAVERLRAYFADQGVPADVFAAVQARGASRPHDMAGRVAAVNAFRKLPEAASLAAANKRIQNILRQVEAAIPAEIDDGLFMEDAEWNLAAKLVGLSPHVREMLKGGDYTGAMRALAGLRESIDAFFDTVKVMDDDDAVRRNRLALLNAIGGLFLATADISKLQG